MKYLKGYRLQASIAIIAKFIEAVFEIIIPLLMARLIDFGVNNNDMSIVYSSFFWILLLTVAGYLFALVCQVNASIVSQAVGGRVRYDLYKHELDLATDQVEDFSSSTLTTRLTNDTVFFQDMIARVIRLGVRAPFLLIGTIGALMYINRKLATILLISIPFFVIVISGFMYITMKEHKNATSKLDRLALRISEILSGTRIIRAFNKQEETDCKFQEDNSNLFKAQRRVSLFSTIANPFTTLLMNILMVVLIYASGVEINIGNMTQGQTLAVINYCNQLLITLIVGMNLIMIISRGLTSYGRINDVLNTESSIEKNGHKEIDSSINLEFKNVSFNYPSEKRQVLKNIDFTLETGKVLGIIGLTGSGKSTLLKLIPRFNEMVSGEILINDYPIEDYDLKDLRASIGYVSQSAQFISGSIEDNISMKNDFDSKSALIDSEGKDILSKGLDDKIEESAKNLSGGQRQRVNIARSLAKKPKLLLLDDSFSALDGLTIRNLQRTLKNKYSDVSQIIVSQRTNSVKHADNILVIDQGEIVARGKHEDLLKSNDIYQRIYNLEKEGLGHE